MKSPLCENVELFSDGALSSDERKAFLEHLGTCQTCPQALMDLAQLYVLETRLQKRMRAGPPVSPEVVTPLRWRKAAFIAGPALAAALAVTIWAVVQNRVPREGFYPGGHERLVAGRSSYLKASDYRPLKQAILGPSSAPAISHDVLARLEKAKDHLGAAAYLLAHGSAQSDEALLKLEELPSTPEVLSERSYAYLVHDNPEQRDFEEALRLADAALALRPGFGPALWNRAVALRELDLSFAAARAFDAVEEPGWSVEAKVEAEKLRETVKKSKQAWDDALTAGKAFVKDDAHPLPKDRALWEASVFRSSFYEAVKVSTSKDQVLALLPTAKKLDDLAGNNILTSHVQEIARHDFARRGPLAADYKRVFNGDKTVRDQLLQRLRSAREPDLLVLVLARLARDNSKSAELPLEELDQLVAATASDPWHLSWALKLKADALQRAGRNEDSRAVLEDALKQCHQAKLEFRCADLAYALAYAYEREAKLEAGMEVARAAWRRTVSANDWNQQGRIILALANMTRLREDTSLAKAYYEEARARIELVPAAPEHLRYIREGLAVLAVNQLRYLEARQHLDAALATRLHLGLPGALALSGLPQPHQPSAGERAMEDFLEKPSGPPLGKGELALAREAYGRWLMGRESNRLEGVRSLRDAIQMASAGGLALQDPDARRALLYAYTALILDAGKRGDAAEALRLFEEEYQGGSKSVLPSRCLLAVTVDGPRTLAVARSANGDSRIAYYDEGRTTPIPESLMDLLPEGAKVLNGCDSVGVLARPPLYGRAGILPSTLAWSYYLGGETTSEAAAPSGDDGTHLMIQRPSPLVVPPWVREKLRTPARWDLDGVEELTGERANPSEVLRKMEDALDIMFITHAVTNPDSNESVLLLAPDPGTGRSTLSASDLQHLHLRHRPLVFLASCKGAMPAPVLHEARSLPAAFIRAGARAVLAASHTIPEREGAKFFAGVRDRILKGAAPTAALRAERETWKKAQGGERPWLDGVLLFE